MELRSTGWGIWKLGAQDMMDGYRATGRCVVQAMPAGGIAPSRAHGHNHNNADHSPSASPTATASSSSSTAAMMRSLEAVFADHEARVGGGPLPPMQRDALAQGFSLAVKAIEMAFGQAVDEGDGSVLQKHTTTADAATQLTTIRGIVLSSHVFEKCALRRKIKRLQRAVAEMASQVEELGRELMRVGMSSRLMSQLLTTTDGGSVPVMSSSSSSGVSSDGGGHWMYKTKGAYLIRSLTNTWRRLEEDVTCPPIRSSTMELLHAWQDAVSLQRDPIRNTAQQQHQQQFDLHGRGGDDEAPALVRMVHDDDEDDVAAALLPSRRDGKEGEYNIHTNNDHQYAHDRQEGGLSSVVGRGSRRGYDASGNPSSTPSQLPIFLCRRCREAGRGGMYYDAAEHKLLPRPPPPRSNLGGVARVGEKPITHSRAAASDLVPTDSAMPSHGNEKPNSPPSRHIVLPVIPLSKRGGGGGAVAAASGSGGGVLQAPDWLAPAVIGYSPRQAAGGGRRHWESSSKVAGIRSRESENSK